MVKHGELSIGGKVIRPATGVVVNDRRGRPACAKPKRLRFGGGRPRIAKRKTARI
jgi:hypothetical protein